MKRIFQRVNIQHEMYIIHQVIRRARAHSLAVLSATTYVRVKKQS